jgi:dipeptidyl-peptidase-4
VFKNQTAYFRLSKYPEVCMLRNFLVLLIVISSIASAQKKKLDLETAVGRDFRPEYAYNIGWLDANTPTWKLSKSPEILFYYKNKVLQLAGIDDLNKLAEEAGMDSVRSFPSGTWLDEEEYLFSDLKAYWKWNYKDTELEKWIDKDPDGEHYTLNPVNNAAAFVKEQNLYLTNDEGETVQITEDGGGEISYGISVHQREMGIRNGIFWSPRGRYIAFYREDKSSVTKYPYVDYTTRPASPDSEMYPMAGMPNTIVTVWIYDTDEEKLIRLETGEPLDQYFTNITWSLEEDLLYIAHNNRDQNHMRLISYNSVSGKMGVTLFEEKDDKYVEPERGPVFVDEERFLWFSERDKWDHLYLYKKNGELVRQLTKGEWEVEEVYGFDEEKKYAYIQCTKDSPLARTIYRVNLETGEMKLLSKGGGVNSINLNPDGTSWMETSSYKENPGQMIFVSANNTKKVTVFKAGDPGSEFDMPFIKLDKIKAADGQTDLYTRTILPPDFDESNKYPVLVYLYGGPHAQLIVNGWQMYARGWLLYMASEGYIVFTVDNRGSGNRGLEFEQATFRNLSEVEIADQLEGIKYLKSLPYVDAERIGVHGWSYGGYMATAMMLRGNDAFKVGIAGAPVIDWSYYESVYTERYMDSPETNEEGFKNTSLLNYVDQLNGRLMIIHGTSDNIVMWQHSVLFVDKCIKQMKMIDYMIYPGHGHGVRGKDRTHLYLKMTQYFNDFLK